MLNLNPRTDVSGRINWLIDAGLAAMHEEPRKYLGCSVLGGTCERAAQYEALATVFRESRQSCEELRPISSFSARVLRIFDRGHDAEDRAADWLRRAGFLLVTADPLSGEQFEVQFCKGVVRGHADGLLTMWRGEGPCPIPLPSLWECKCLEHKWVMRARKEHIRSTHPKYFSQMQLYMGGLGLEQGLITCIDANTMEVYHELVRFEPDMFEALLRRAERILVACNDGEMLPRGETTEASVACRMCHWASACWGKSCPR